MMMYPLEAGRLPRLLPLVPHPRDAGHMALVHAVIGADHPGTALVDNVDLPRSALVFNRAGFGFALGEPRPDLLVPVLGDLIDQDFIAAQPTALWCTVPQWAEALRPHFREERSRDEFHFDGERAPAAAPLPDGYRLQQLDEALATRWGEGLDPWVTRIWGSPAALAALAFGVGVLHGSALVADCVACAIGGPRGYVEAEIEIGTAPAHRRKHLALAAAVAFFEQCRARELIPAWTCDSRNAASRLLAEQLGFEYARSVVGFRLRRDALA